MKLYEYNSTSSNKTNVKPSTKSEEKIIKTIQIGKYKINISWQKITTWSLRLIAIFVLFIAFLFIYYSRILPDPNRLIGRNVSESTKIFDRNGKLVHEIHGEVKRTLVNLDQISPHLQNATIAVEDKDFYNHSGISIRGLVRSIIVDILAGKKKQGGSTITQQFIKNAVLSREKTFSRKIAEIILSIELEARFSKQDILKLYLNEIPYGKNSYGAEAASQTFFSKSAKDLTIAESAYLAALPQAPTYYNPYGTNKTALDARQKHILSLMHEQNYINTDEYQNALNQKVEFSVEKNSINAPHFSFYIQDYLAQKYGEETVQEGGLEVYTTLDLDLQLQAEKIVKDGIESIQGRYGAYNGSLVAVETKTGQILAMVGSKDYFGEPLPKNCTPGSNCSFEPNFNVSTSQRQPGSSFKPYVFLTAVGKDYNYYPGSVLMDVTTNFGSGGTKDYIPQNYNLNNYGPVTIRQALAGSLNIPAVKMLSLVGLDAATKTAKSLGITSPLENCGLALVLGSCEVKLIDHVSAFSVLGNMGEKHDKTAILKVIDQSGNTLEEYKDSSKSVFDKQAVYELLSIMSDNNARSYIFGANNPLNYGDQSVACKTGTTQSWRDAWTLCTSTGITAGVWVGNNQGAFMKNGADGAVAAAPILKKFMNTAFKTYKPEKFQEPEGIQKVVIDADSGKLASKNSTRVLNEIASDYAAPKDYDNVNVLVKFDRTTNTKATEETLPENIEERIVKIFHSERPDNPAWENAVQAWAAKNGYGINGGGINPDTSNNVLFIGITNNQTFNSLPIKFSANPPSNTGRVSILLDNTLLATKTSAPYEFQINESLDQGQHKITATYTNDAGVSTDTSINFDFQNSKTNLYLSGINNGSTITLPENIEASSGTKFNSVTFYYQNEAGVTKTIGASQGQLINNEYTYSIEWKSSLPPGNYRIYAKSDTGIQTSKIKIIIK